MDQLARKIVSNALVVLTECDRDTADRFYKGFRWQLVAKEYSPMPQSSKARQQAELFAIGFDRKNQAEAAFRRMNEDVIAGLFRVKKLRHEADDHENNLFRTIRGGKW